MYYTDTVASSLPGVVTAHQIAQGVTIEGVEETEYLDSYNRYPRWFILEGGKRAQELFAGQWVVTRPDGVREYVTDEQFQARYVPVADAETTPQ